MGLMKLFDRITLDPHYKSKCHKLSEICDKIESVNCEVCYNVQVANGGSLTDGQFKLLKNLLSRPQKAQQLSEESHLTREYPFNFAKKTWTMCC